MQAPITPITGLDRLPFDADALTSAHLDDLQDRLTDQMPSLRIEFVDPPAGESMSTGQQLTLRLRGVPLPEIDLARGQLAATTRRKDTTPSWSSSKASTHPSWRPARSIGARRC